MILFLFMFFTFDIVFNYVFYEVFFFFCCSFRSCCYAWLCYDGCICFFVIVQVVGFFNSIFCAHKTFKERKRMNEKILKMTIIK